MILGCHVLTLYGPVPKYTGPVVLSPLRLQMSKPPSGARPSIDIVLKERLDMFISMFLRLSMIPYDLYGYDDVIQNDQRDLEKSRGTWSVNTYQSTSAHCL